MDFTERLQALRRERGMTHSQLAGDFKKSEGSIRSWEAGRSKPDLDILIELAKYFGCTTDYLLGLDDYRNKKDKNDIATLSVTLNETISKIPNGKDLFEDLVSFLNFTDMDSYEKTTHTFLRVAQLFLVHFSEMQKIRDSFMQSQTFDLALYVDFIAKISTASAGANRLMHIISTIPILSLIQQTEGCGSKTDRELAWKMYRAYYERFIYDIPAKNPYDVI